MAAPNNPLHLFLGSAILVTDTYVNSNLKKECNMFPGVSTARKKDGSLYFRSGITYRGKHISLGSYDSAEDAATAYREAGRLLTDPSIDLLSVSFDELTMPFEKAVVLLNFRDNQLYFKNPIYLRKGYFSYFLTPAMELKFDIDDLFYYSSHKIQRRQGHLFVSDYGMQYSILARYGIRPYAVAGRDYTFSNGDTLDFRYSNIIVWNHYHGVRQIQKNGILRYESLIHINGNYRLGIYSTEEKAAIAYNKAVDLAKSAGITKQFPENYIDSYSPREYAEVYTKLHLSKRYLDYLERLM